MMQVLDFIVYSDGSKLPSGQAGAGFIIRQGKRTLMSKAISLPNHTEVFDAEAIAACEGLREALELYVTMFATNLWLLLDNKEVATRLVSKHTGSSQEVFVEFRRLCESWKARSRNPGIKVGEVKVLWIPGHSGIEGNELADKQARIGAELSHSGPPTPLTIASLRSTQIKHLEDRRQEWWKTFQPKRYTDLGITTTPRAPKELTLPRATLARLLASRTGHGDFAEYHRRFDHADAELTCTCGQDKSPDHFFYCVRGRRLSRDLTGNPRTSIANILGTNEGITRLAKWLEDTSFYKNICPRAHPIME